jgi:hypothetical protein
MERETIVYGCIIDEHVFESQDRLSINKQAIAGLPDFHECHLVYRQMFGGLYSGRVGTGETSVIHFGAAYHSVEYEWAVWINRFADLLKKLFWDSVTVHLDTEFSGSHTFNWQSTSASHIPQMDPMNVRCQWVREFA